MIVGGIAHNTYSMDDSKLFYSIVVVGSLLTACGTPNENYCKLPSDCAGNQDCVGNLCEDKPALDGGDLIDAGLPPAMAATPTLELRPIKTFHFTWTDVADATHYKLLENADGASEFIQVGNDVAAAAQSIDHIVPLYARVNAKYILQTCNTNACIDSAVVEVTGTLQEAIGYVKASNTDEGDGFGNAVALSADGKTLAVGALREDSNAAGIGGDEEDDSLADAGAVYVFTWEDNSWSQQEFLKASNPGEGDRFGSSLALSADGSTLVVAAAGEDSSATGIGGIQDSDLASDSGAAYVFERVGGSWAQQAYVKASNSASLDLFGDSLALSADGNTLAVGAPGEDSNSVGINGNQNNNLGLNAGAVYVFSRTGTSWNQRAYVKASNTRDNDDALFGAVAFGWSVALSGDASTLAVGAPYESSNATGVDGDQSNELASAAGAGYVFSRTGSSWNQEAYVKASNTGESDRFGFSMTLNADGSTLAVGAVGEAIGGAAYVFSRTGSWNEEAYLKASNTGSNDQFGSSMTLGADGKVLAVGALREGSAAIGIDGDDDDSFTNAGAAYVFTLIDDTWSEQAYVKASNTDSIDVFGSSLGLSANGNTLVVGAHGEDSSATGVGGDLNSNSAVGSGAIYIF